MKVYDQVKLILKNFPETRNSDKELIWRAIVGENFPKSYGLLTYKGFMESPSFETIRRCRQKIQELEMEKVRKGEIEMNNSLLADKQILEYRRNKEKSKGTFIYDVENDIEIRP